MVAAPEREGGEEVEVGCLLVESTGVRTLQPTCCCTATCICPSSVQLPRGYS